MLITESKTMDKGHYGEKKRYLKKEKVNKKSNSL